MRFLSSVDFFNEVFQKKKKKKKKKKSELSSECQTVCIQIRPDKTSGLIWIQTVYNGYQQTTKVATSGERVSGLFLKVTWSCEIEVSHMVKSLSHTGKSGRNTYLEHLW